MSDELKNKATGTLKEGFGKITGDEGTELEGKAQRLMGEAQEKLKDAKDAIADKANDLIDKVENKLKDE